MTRPGDQPHDERDPRLADLLSDAVSGRRARQHGSTPSATETKVTSMSSRRPWLYAVGGAVVATAAVITAIAAAGGSLPGQGDDDPAPAGQSEHGDEEPTTADRRVRADAVRDQRAPPSSLGGARLLRGRHAQRAPALPRVPPNTDGVDPLVYAAATSVAGSRRRPGLRHPVAVRRLRHRGDLRTARTSSPSARRCARTTCPRG